MKFIDGFHLGEAEDLRSVAIGGFSVKGVTVRALIDALLECNQSSVVTVPGPGLNPQGVAAVAVARGDAVSIMSLAQLTLTALHVAETVAAKEDPK